MFCGFAAICVWPDSAGLGLHEAFCNEFYKVVNEFISSAQLLTEAVIFFHLPGTLLLYHKLLLCVCHTVAP